MNSPLCLFNTHSEIKNDPFDVWKYIEATGDYTCPICKKKIVNNVDKLLISKEPIDETTQIYSVFFYHHITLKDVDGIRATHLAATEQMYMQELAVICSATCLDIFNLTGTIE